MQDAKPRILIATLGTRGDVQPYIALARELVKLGAEVVVSTGEGFETMIENAGARSRPAAINFQALLQQDEIKEALHSVTGKLKAARRNMALQQNVAKDFWTTGLEEKPDLILFNLKATVMTLVGRRLDVPALSTALQPVIAPTRAFPLALFGIPDMGPYLNRKSFGLGRLLMRFGLGALFKPLRTEAAKELGATGSTIDGFAPERMSALSLQAYSRALVPTPDDWSAEYWQCGYWFTDPDPDFTPPEDLARFLGDGAPPVYLGFGSMPSKDPKDLTEILFGALGMTGQRAVIATGWGGLVKETLPSGLAERVLVIDNAPHSWLFPKCAGIVHHGGAGTTHEALRWGRPSLVCPVFGDQPFWAERVHKIGAGPAPIPQKKLTPEALSGALEELEKQDHATSAEKAAAEMAREPGARGTAERLMGLLAPS
ncbi:glycosyltransferase [Roseibium sp. MMSF_3544]|uniref:glycosyltransferase n=1 Tax=unclassified Roseibium TaxID=2629323 RepID=UPI00273D9203|nr:glycosyltransferase [Roseibium sp. MMSF_3544]